jgi:anion-transporting  ArsA/GET3 family ATPase
MKACFEQSRILLVGGPGGVGKTTLAASLGVALAEKGYRTVVLTVDPAKRLAQALGFKNFSQEVQQVPLPPPLKGELHASMLDAQRYFDRIIERFATSPEQKQRILANPMYQIMVESLGGSHEYAAMERLLEFAQDPKWERIVVDTPPTDNAMELIAAPKRLADFMDNSVLSWFQGSGALYLRLFRTGTRLAMKALQTIFGSDFLDSLAKFLNDIEGMQAGFQSRHREVLTMLRSPSCSFFLTTFPSEARWEDSQKLARLLKDESIPFRGVFMNRVEKDPGPEPLPMAAISPAAFEQLRQLWHYQSKEVANQSLWKEKYSSLGADFVVTIPRQSRPIHDVASLSELGKLLVS